MIENDFTEKTIYQSKSVEINVIRNLILKVILSVIFKSDKIKNPHIK